jgi:hypothetical protein
MFIQIKDNLPEVYTIEQLRKDNPDVSFPKEIPTDTLESFNVYSVNELSRPTFDPETHYLKTSEFYQVNGQWQVHYYPEPLPEQQVAETMRSKRDGLLAASDWVVAVAYEQQVLVSEPWSTYRQALRDITAQEGFPYEVVWPTKPE